MSTFKRSVFLYAPLYRPPVFGSVPAGCYIIEQGPLFLLPKRTDLPVGKHPFGLIAYTYELSTEQVEDYQLRPCGTRPS